MFTYSVQTFHLLERPYSTDCIKYSEKTAFLSREDCERKCRIRESQSKCGVIPNEIDVMRGEPNVKFSETGEEGECIQRLDLKKYCYDMCPKDNCLIAHYKPIVISLNNHLDGELFVSLLAPSEPDTSYHHKPSVELIEFLCYLASTIALWFGVSMFSISCYLQSINLNPINVKIKSFTNLNRF